MKALAVLLVLTELAYVTLLRVDTINGTEPVVTFLALLALLFALYWMAFVVVQRVQPPGRGTLPIIVIGAVMFRLTLLPAGLPHAFGSDARLPALRADVRGEAVSFERFLLYDDDIWRYLWDGHVWAHGINPYQHAPAAVALDDLTDEESAELSDGRAVWSDVRDNVNYSAIPTIYPPLSQAVFRLSHAIAPGSVLVMKGLIVSFDLLALLFIGMTLNALGRSMTPVLLYAWNPLVIKVFAGSGHVDAVLVAALAATTYFLVRGARRAAAVSFAMAVLAKISPLILFPYVVRRIGWRYAALACAVLVAGYVPFLDAGLAMFDGIVTFAREWQFNAGPFTFVQWMAGAVTSHPDVLARATSAFAAVGVVFWLAWRDDGRGESFPKYGAVALGVLIVLSPAVMPWYVIWVLPFAVIAGQRVWIYFTMLVCLAFLIMIDGIERSGTLWLEYSLFAVLALLEYRRAPRRGATRNSYLAPAAVAAPLEQRKAVFEPRRVHQP